MGRAVFPPCSLACDHTMVGVVVTSFKMTYASMLRLPGLLYSLVLTPWQATANHASVKDSWALTGKSGSVSCGVTAPFSWVLYVQGFIVPFMSLFPCGFSVLWTDPQVVKSVVGPRILQQCKNFFGIIVLQFVSHLLSSPMVGLMATSSKRIYATRSTSQVYCSQSHCPIKFVSGTLMGDIKSVASGWDFWTGQVKKWCFHLLKRWRLKEQQNFCCLLTCKSQHTCIDLM